MTRKHAVKTSPSKVLLPITPFLDMAFQLMFFFVLTFRPQAQEGQIAMFLPAPKGGAPSTPPPAIDEPLEEKEEYTIRVRSNNGDIASISFADKAGAPQEIGRQPSDLFRKLQSIALPDGAKRPSIKIEAMNDLVYGRLVQIMDVCIKAGFDSVGVAPLIEAPAP